uniref:Uncharacterized protein n=1 Tax=candidate division CPR3 bacterium TaxID=2268181 RepID=A0A7V3J9J5_UNCC3
MKLLTLALGTVVTRICPVFGTRFSSANTRSIGKFSGNASVAEPILQTNGIYPRPARYLGVVALLDYYDVAIVAIDDLPYGGIDPPMSWGPMFLLF